MMRSHLTPVLAVLTLMAANVQADTNIVTETFDGYTDQAAFQAVWRPDKGNGYTAPTAPTGVLVPSPGFSGINAPNDDPPGIMGKGIAVVGQINEYDGDNDISTVPFQIVPSSTQSVRVAGDIFSDAAGNKRTSIGLRSIDDPTATTPATTNIIELGHYQAATTDPTTGNAIPAVTGFAYRVILFDGPPYTAPLIRQVNWQYFPLDSALDTKDGAAQPNPDGLVTPTDIGVGWHRYSATVTETTITLELDLFRDGLKNSEATAGVGTAGVDSSVTWTIAPAETDVTDAFDFDPFNSLRIGTPSGIGTLQHSVFDNISLDLIDVVGGAADADFNGDDLVDGSDFLVWQRNVGTADPLQADGDANGDDAVDGGDLGVWSTQYGAAPPATASLAAVPEPSTGLLGVLFLLGVCKARAPRRASS